MASMATFEEDEKECADQLANLASCIPFVSGTASKPTPQCCQDTQKVKTNKPKCLCVLNKESTDPSMGLPVNTTLALHMPSICKIEASVSNCPTLLNLSPDSPNTKIFKDASGSDSSKSSTANSPSSRASSSSTSSSSGSSSQADSKSNAGAKMKLVGD
ncbi:protein YLS3-like [Tripterygium wilfordii]|uniref:Protein YLS3-like n=1 Tax=Tripterygium wilfordii TaxID=458696 RepID=A0A7J7D998_TRIWF|nr:protein YLS3-like [Tripterygium wilfordii]